VIVISERVQQVATIQYYESRFSATSTRSDILFSLLFFISVFQHILIIFSLLILCRTLNSSTVLPWSTVTCSPRAQEGLSLWLPVFLLIDSRAQKNQNCTECALEPAVGLILTDGFLPLILADCINQSSDICCVIIGWFRSSNTTVYFLLPILLSVSLCLSNINNYTRLHPRM
jgi:hypothetical protein